MFLTLMVVKIETKISLKEYNPLYKEKVFDLRKAVYNQSFDDEEWQWKFKFSKILIAVNDEDEVISLRPTILVKLKYKDQIIDGGINVDVMTHPDYRRLGLFSKLVNYSFEKLKADNVSLVYTFPNRFSFPGYLNKDKINWTHIESIPLYVKILNTKNVLGNFVKNKKLAEILAAPIDLFINKRGNKGYNNISVEKINFFDGEFDILWQNVSDNIKISVVRDCDYLNWRYIERPNYNYQIFAAKNDDILTGYIILREETELFNMKLGLIVDILSADEETTNALLDYAYKKFKKDDIDIMGCLVLRKSLYEDQIKNSGFFKVPKKFSPKEFYFVAKVNEELIDPEIVYNSKNWFLMFGDIDIS